MTIWGLSAKQVHDAYWKGRGVQCLRQGESGDRASINRTADLYLLLEPDQCVLFDLSALIERLVWRGAAVTRLKIIEQSPVSYDERIVCDERGLVQRIERCYPNAAGRGVANGIQHSRRVFITDRQWVAARWIAAATPREGWKRIQRSLSGRGRIDRVRTPGRSIRLRSQPEEKSLLDALVSRWNDPDRVIDGIDQIAPGVWKLARDHACDPTRLIGPVWLGCGRAAGKPRNDGLDTNAAAPRNHQGKDSDRSARSHLCIVGPAWLRDDSDALAAAVQVEKSHPAVIRDMMDIELAESHGRQRRPNPPSAYPFVKRSMDAVVSACLLVLFAPLLALIALAILIDDGRPIMFRHKRQTLGGRVFNCLKFRTMQRDADRMASQLQTLNVCDGPQMYIRDDPRVTRVGRLLRLLHLDELPQLWNVLVGEMSLVGPRPSPDKENQYCPAWRELRLSVRPGITGLWQLKRTRSPGQDFQEWIRYDIEYVRNASILLDLRILFATAGVLLFGFRKHVRACDEQE